MLVSPLAHGRAGASHVSGVFASSDVEYETDGADPDIERTIIGAEYSYGFSADSDVVAQVGIIIDSEIDLLDYEGEGFLFGGGARTIFKRDGQMTVHGFALFSYQKEDFEDEVAGIDYSLDATTYELHLGSVAAYAVTPTVSAYGGAELLLLNDGEVESDPGDGDSDLERDDIFNLKLGANIAVDSLTIRPEATLFGEQTFLLAVGTAF
jgi:hypothetical protein